MELSVDLSALERLCRSIGDERQLSTREVVLPPPILSSDLHRRLARGIKLGDLSELDITEEHLMVFHGIPVTVHQWDFSRTDVYALRHQNRRNKIYHILHCPTIVSMKKEGKSRGKLMISHRQTPSFHVEARRKRETMDVNLHFPICRKCLVMAGGIRWWHLPAKRQELAETFQLGAFMQQAGRIVVARAFNRAAVTDKPRARARGKARGRAKTKTRS